MSREPEEFWIAVEPERWSKKTRGGEDVEEWTSADWRSEALRAVIALRGGYGEQDVFREDELSVVLDEAERVYRWIVRGDR